MKKLSILAASILSLTALSQAQGGMFEGFGYDNSTNEAVVRLGLGGYNHVEVGLGFVYDGGAADATVAQEDARQTFAASARYLLALHQWDRFNGYLHLGAYFRDDNLALPLNSPFLNASSRAMAFALFAGYEPEVVLFQHLNVSTRLGVAVPITPDVQIGVVGAGISIVNGINFRIIF